MNSFLYTTGKCFTIFTGLTLVVHSRFMPPTLKYKMNPHPIFEKNIKYKNNDMPPTAYA